MNTCRKCGFAELRFSAYHHFRRWSNTDLRQCGEAETQKCGNTIFRSIGLGRVLVAIALVLLLLWLVWR
jgi:hypothetical protein